MTDQQENIFGTLSAAMVTPFTDDGALDLDGTAMLADKLVSDGCDSLVVTGTTGETPTLTDDENLDMFRTVTEAVAGRAKVIAGTGTNDTRHSISLSQRAEKLGVDGLLVVTPYYNKPSQEGILAHFNAIADATELPIMIYDIPGRTGTAIATETLQRMAEHPRIRGLKDAKADFAATTRVLASTDLHVYSGDDALTLPWMSAGARGVVSVTAQVATAKFRALVDAANAGDFVTARKLHFELDPAIRGVMTHMQGAVAAKQVLQWQHVLPNAVVRLPLVQPSQAELELVRADLQEAGLL